MVVTQTALPGVLVIEPTVHRDHRGFFVETYRHDRYVAAGVHATFVQDNHSRSGKGTLRGLHLQVQSRQAKLVRVVSGEIFDVAVDVTLGSPTFGRWVGVTLTAENFTQLFVPAGFAHGFAVLSDVAEVEYKCSAVYDPADEIAIRYDDPAIGVAWPVAAEQLSPRDAAAPLLKDVHPRLPRVSA